MASFVFRTSDLPKLDLDTDKGTDFQAWHQQWLAYRSLSGLDKEPATKQVQALQLCFSRETLNVVDNLGLTAAEKTDQAQIIAALKRHVDGRINETIERRNFRRRTQQVGECFDDFLVSLRELTKTCNFCNNDCLQKALRDQIIEGLLDGEIIQELLQVKDLTLDQAITMCRGLEAAKKSRHEVQGSPEVSTFRMQHGTGTSCQGCGAPFHDGGRKRCPAYNQTCHKCGKTGHFSRVCRQKNPPSRSDHKTVPHANALSTGELPLVRLSELANRTVSPAPTVNMQVSTCHGQASLDILPDSGADICAAGPQFVQALGEHMQNLADSRITPRAVNGSILHPVGKLPNVAFCVNSTTVYDDVHIYESVSGALISWATAKQLGILPDCYPKPVGYIQTTQTNSGINKTNDPLPTAEQIMSEFPSVFDGQVRTMPGEQFHISLTDEARPFCVTSPRTIPFAYRDKLKKELDLLMDQGIIAPVTEPTDWCAPIVVVPKKDTDRIRMCVDLSKLNKFIRREHYPSITPAEAVTDIQQAKAKCFTVFDALKGYHQCPLDAASQKLTTFITPFGRYMYLRAPYGICSISEHYDRRMDEVFAEVQNFRKIVDDVVVFDQDEKKHVEHVREILRLCQEKGISLNREKFKFCQPKAHFAGLTLTPEGYSVSNEIIDAIAKFPKPSSRTDLRSFFGLANQLGSSTNKLALVLAPLRSLLSTHNDFLWTSAHDEAFLQAKQSLTTAPTLAYFDPSRETFLYTDASTLGLGFLLLQKSSEDSSVWNVVQAGSRFLTDTETRYAVIELECLAVAWAIKKCHLFLAGLGHFTLITDHHPLIPILNSHRLDEIENPRLQRLRTRIMGYNFTAQWLKGTSNEAADALSRHPHDQPVDGDDLGEQEVDTHHFQAAVYQALTLQQVRMSAASQHDMENLHLQELRHHAMQDQTYQTLKTIITEGFPNQKCSLPDSVKRFWSVKDHLSIDDDLIVYGCRLLVPSTLQATMLSRLHNAHQGIARSQARARLTIYWPGIDQDIENFVGSCRHCQNHLPSNCKEPMICKQKPERPFQQIAADLASYGGKQFLIVVDCKTDWPDIVEMGNDTTAPKLAATLRDQFCRTAAPDQLWSDGGPQFTSHYLSNFLQSWGVKHLTSSPHYPQSNGKAEATVKSMKKLITAAWTGRSINWDILSRSLLQYRNTPCRKDGLSPAQKLFGHPVQDTLPAHRRSFAPEWQRSIEAAEITSTQERERAQASYNQHAYSLPDLEIGNRVALQNNTSKMWDIYGTITATGPYRRYFIKTHSGRVLVRNRRFIRKRSPISLEGPPSGSLQTPANSAPQPVHQPHPRRSSRTSRRPSRLVEDPAWLFSSSVCTT